MQLNQIDWNSSDFLKTRIFKHISCYSLSLNGVNYFNLMQFMLSVFDFLRTRILNISGWFLFHPETIITIHSSYFQINQIKCIDDIIKIIQLNQTDWNSSDFLKTRIFTHISGYSSNMTYLRCPTGYQQ